MKPPAYPFLKEAGRIINSGQSRTLLFTGNVNDLFFSGADETGRYVPLTDLLAEHWRVPGKLLVVYELNGPIRFAQDADRRKAAAAWNRLHGAPDEDQAAIDLALAPTGRDRERLRQARETAFDRRLQKAIGNPTLALEFLRQLCLGSRMTADGEPLLREDLVILIEAADMLVPEGEVGRLSDVDRHRVAVCRDWFSDPAFANGGDTVVLVAESRSAINGRIAALPQVLDVEAPAPDADHRAYCIRWFNQQLPDDRKLKLWSSQAELAELTAGLSIHALVQLLKGAAHYNERLAPADVLAKVEAFIKSQLGDDVVEFKKPEHTLRDVVGFSGLKAFLKDEFIPRIRSSGSDALPGAAVCGPIGSGKTFIFEAVAGELGIVVLTLKNIRSQWFGQTDVLFERLRRILGAIREALIFIDEADTQFGGVSEGTHATERRLTGKIQAMMSDPALRGRVSWLLITARIHLLSADIRRPGRAGSLIIPILDPTGEDLDGFLAWMLKPVTREKPSPADLQRVRAALGGASAATFADLRSSLCARARRAGGGTLSLDEILEVMHDHLPPAIADVREYQALQALVNCTRRGLLPDPNVTDAQRQAWQHRIRELEAQGIR